MRLRLVIYSQRGNVLFPAWEYFIPKVGINARPLCMISSSYWKIRMPYWTINGAYSTKLLISPIRPPEVLYSKGFRWFHPSHNPSRQLSHIPPVLYNFEKREGSCFGKRTSSSGRERWWERYGRDQKHLSRALTPFYKGFPRDLGRDERFLACK